MRMKMFANKIVPGSNLTAPAGIIAFGFGDDDVCQTRGGKLLVDAGVAEGVRYAKVFGGAPGVVGSTRNKDLFKVKCFNFDVHTLNMCQNTCVNSLLMLATKYREWVQWTAVPDAAVRPFYRLQAAQADVRSGETLCDWVDKHKTFTVTIQQVR